MIYKNLIALSLFVHIFRLVTSGRDTNLTSNYSLRIWELGLQNKTRFSGMKPKKSRLMCRSQYSICSVCSRMWKKHEEKLRGYKYEFYTNNVYYKMPRIKALWSQMIYEIILSAGCRSRLLKKNV